MIGSADTKLPFYKWSLISNSWHCLLPPSLQVDNSPAWCHLTSCLRLVTLVMCGLCHEVTRPVVTRPQPHLACHNLYQMTLLRMMQLGDQFPQASGWRWYSGLVTKQSHCTISALSGWRMIISPMLHCGLWGSNMCDVSEECFELKYNYVDERSLSVSISLNSSLIAPSSYNRGLWPGTE